MQKIVIVGGGLAAHRAALEIVRGGKNVELTVVSDEDSLPYDRPPLSKQFLFDPSSQIVLGGSEVYDGKAATFVTGTRIYEIDPSQKKVFSAAKCFHYDRLIVATGSRVRRLQFDGFDDNALLYLRSVKDAERLRAGLRQGRRVVIVGGGFIGLEVAASAVALGCAVTVIETQKRLLARTAPPFLSDWALGIHTEQGVNIALGTALTSMKRAVSGTFVIETTNGPLEADTVVVGIGVEPNVELARNAGLNVENGIVVDEHCHTSDHSILAAGEVTSYPLRTLGIRTRSESWSVAGEQGAVAGRAAIKCENIGYHDLPWLWSDQYEYNIQYLGVPRVACSYSSHSGPSGSWMKIGWDETGHMVGAISVNMGRDMSRLRRALKNGQAFPEEYVTADRVPLSEKPEPQLAS